MGKMLVTGGAGFIGSHLVDLLIAEGHEVFVYDSLSTGKKENLNPKAIFEQISVQSVRLQNHGFEVIFHLAGEARIQPSFSFPQQTHESNVSGTVAMLELARICGSKFVFAGSSSVYHDIYANPYSFSKQIGEYYCKLWWEIYRVPVAIARFFNCFGPRQIEDGPYSTVLGIFLNQKKSGKPLTVTGTGEQRRDFCHVADIVSGLYAMSKDEWGAHVFDLGSGINYSVNEVAKMFDQPIEYIPQRRGEAINTLADIRNARIWLGWMPKHNVCDYVKSEIQK